MNGENVKQLFARATKGPFEFDFMYGDRHKENPASPYMTDPLAGGASVNDCRLNTQVQYNDNFSNGTLNVLGRLFLGQYCYSQPDIYSGDETASSGPSDWHGAELRLLSTALTDHKLMVGVEYQNNTRINQTFQNFTNPADNIAIHSSVVRVGFYTQDEWRIKRKTLDGSNTDSYVLSNLNLVNNVRWAKGLEASLSIYHLFNKNYQHPAAATNWQNFFWQPGRTVRLRMDYRF